MSADLKNTTAAMLAAGGGVTISLSGVNEVLTCVSLCVGITVASVSLCRILRSKKHNHKKK